MEGRNVKGTCAYHLYLGGEGEGDSKATKTEGSSRYYVKFSTEITFIPNSPTEFLNRFFSIQPNESILFDT